MDAGCGAEFGPSPRSGFLPHAVAAAAVAGPGPVAVAGRSGTGPGAGDPAPRTNPVAAGDGPRSIAGSRPPLSAAGGVGGGGPGTGPLDDVGGAGCGPLAGSDGQRTEMGGRSGNPFVMAGEGQPPAGGRGRAPAPRADR